MGREEASRRRVACLSDARGHEMKWLGRGWARQGTRTSSSDSTAGSELHGCLPVQQVSAYKTPESPGQAAASPVVGPLEVLGGPHHSPPCLEGSRDSPRCLGRERWRDGGIRWLPQPEVTWGVWTDSPGTTDAVSPRAWHHASSKPHSKKQGPFSPLYRQWYSASATENLPVTPSQSLHSSGSPFPFP